MRPELPTRSHYNKQPSSQNASRTIASGDIRLVFDCRDGVTGLRLASGELVLVTNSFEECCYRLREGAALECAIYPLASGGNKAAQPQGPHKFRRIKHQLLNV